MISINPKINEMHQAYCKCTGNKVSWHPGCDSIWWNWIKFRTPAFTEEDLRFVVTNILKGIRLGQRHRGALKFTNLIGRPDFFEEDLELYRGMERANAKPIPPATVQVTVNGTTRTQPNLNLNDTSRPVAKVLPPERLAGYLSELRKAAQ